ncbi:MAG: excisionase family DNA-binding protein [Pseudobdellovibrionaceae bacterium]
MKTLCFLKNDINPSSEFFENYIDKEALSEKLSISVSLINKWMKEKKIRFHKFGRRVLFKFSEVVVDLQKRSSTS